MKCSITFNWVNQFSFQGQLKLRAQWLIANEIAGNALTKFDWINAKRGFIDCQQCNNMNLSLPRYLIEKLFVSVSLGCFFFFIRARSLACLSRRFQDLEYKNITIFETKLSIIRWFVFREKFGSFWGLMKACSLKYVKRLQRTTFVAKFIGSSSARLGNRFDLPEKDKQCFAWFLTASKRQCQS